MAVQPTALTLAMAAGHKLKLKHRLSTMSTSLHRGPLPICVAFCVRIGGWLPPWLFSPQHTTLAGHGGIKQLLMNVDINTIDQHCNISDHTDSSGESFVTSWRRHERA
jgi:hypothetical protein